MSKVLACAQIRSVYGNVRQNIDHHLLVCKRAAEVGVHVLVFPELSLTGYELELADSHQRSADDSIFEPLNTFARDNGMLIIAGMPIKASNTLSKPYLAALILGNRSTTDKNYYAKMHVQDQESTNFQPGTEYCILCHADMSIGVGICADLTEESHATNTRAAGATVYAVGALLCESAFARERTLLRKYASDLNMTVLFANFAPKYVGTSLESVGKSSIWSNGGELIAQASDSDDGEVLVIAEARADGSWRGQVLSLF